MCCWKAATGLPQNDGMNMPMKNFFHASDHPCGVLLSTAALMPLAHAGQLHRRQRQAARHLLNRTGFAANDGEIRTFAALSRAEAADPAAGGNAAGRQHRSRRRGSMSADRARQAAGDDPGRTDGRTAAQWHAFELREWWFREMLTTASPLTEKMTLFWHNHFATSQQKVRFTPLLYQQNVMLRRNALGNFGSMLRQVARDPAMLIYLDAANSRKEQPNENFAREVMELFTLGEGQYTEKDIKEAARAFTGWSVDRETGQYMFRRGIHDYGVKTVLGKTGNLDGDQVIDVLLRKPETALFLTRKLWREFISPVPDEAAVARLAAEFRDSGYNIAKVLRAMLVSDAFYAMRKPRHADQIAGRAGGRHNETVRDRHAQYAAVRAGLGAAGAKRVCAAQRQGLAGWRGVDQLRHVAGAQAADRPPVPQRGPDGIGDAQHG
jgi:uncharacterized protein (DUF1800 family)